MGGEMPDWNYDRGAKTCELIMLGRDTCGMPADPCPYCSRPHYFCPSCFPEHNKIHQPKPVEPKKVEVTLGICKICELVGAYANGRGCSGCGGETEPLKAALSSTGIVFFREEQ